MNFSVIRGNSPIKTNYDKLFSSSDVWLIFFSINYSTYFLFDFFLIRSWEGLKKLLKVMADLKVAIQNKCVSRQIRSNLVKLNVEMAACGGLLLHDKSKFVGVFCLSPWQSNFLLYLETV